MTDIKIDDGMVRRCQADLIRGQKVIINMQEERIEEYEKRLLAILPHDSQHFLDIRAGREMRQALDNWNERASARVAAEFGDKAGEWTRTEPNDVEHDAWERRHYEHSSGYIWLRIELLRDEKGITGDSRLSVVAKYLDEGTQWLPHGIPHSLLSDVLEMLEAHRQRFARPEVSDGRSL